MQKIFIIAGEASGDLYGAKLAREIIAKNPGIKLVGMGGKLMRAAGVELIIDAKVLAVVGLVDVLKNIGKIRAAIKTLKQALHAQRPDLIILIDYAGFNLRIAKIAHNAGIKVLYYISPKIWAWHQSRIKIIKRYVDHMTVVHPFEVDLYRKAGVPVTFVGHPLLDIVKPQAPSATTSRALLGLKSNNAKIIGLMPGSRKSEIKYLLPIMIKAAELIHLKYPDTQFILPIASSLTRADLAPYLTATHLPIKLITNQQHLYDAMQACDAIIVASGTATLEVTLLGVPLVIIYKTSLLNYIIAKLLIKVPFLGLPNIIAGKGIVPELLQDAAQPATIAAAIIKMIDDIPYRKQIIADLNAVRQQLNYPAETGIIEIIKMLTPNNVL